MKQDTLYTIIIYREKKEIKIINNHNNILIFKSKYTDDNEMYQYALKVVRLCDNVDQINIIYK